MAYGSRAGMEVMVTGKSGIGTAKAVIGIKLTRQNAAEFCELYLQDTSKGCAKKVLKEDGGRLRPQVAGNCRTGTFTDMYGQRFAVKGRNTAPSDDLSADYIIIDRASGEALDGSMASGYIVARDVFEALCPGVLARLK